MKVTAYEGVVENGRVRLLDEVHIPENARVYVIVPEAVFEVEVKPVSCIASPRLAHPEQAKDFVKEVEILEEGTDAAL